ncbi:MAG: LytTR family DNA-binding domain-containing protein [Clostridia bacterium]|nr:LytTR family DNA-binding domain-containing protein [Clostridia bacterium]
MKIALCDDEKAELDKLYALITDYAARMNYDIQVEAYDSPAELLTRERFDLYFLDYVMDEMDGVELGKRLNEKFTGAVTICYLTSYEAAATRVINEQIHADGFLTKPTQPDLLYEKLDKFYKSSCYGRMELRQGRSFCTVYPRDIYYIEADGKSSTVYFESRSDSFTHMLSEMEELLSGYGLFYRIHRSYIINMMYVASYDAKSVTLTNGAYLPLKSKNFQAAYRAYIYNTMDN